MYICVYIGENTESRGGREYGSAADGAGAAKPYPRHFGSWRL